MKTHIKYDKHIDIVRKAIKNLGGIDSIMDKMPHVFDFLRVNPLKGYDR